MSTLLLKIKGIFETAQRSHANHENGVRELHDLFVEATASDRGDEFTSVFVLMVNHVLVQFNREPCIERCVEFIVNFCTNSTVSNGSSAHGLLFDFLVRHLLTTSAAQSKAVRFRSCQLISKLLNTLDDGAEVDVKLWADVQSKMLIRIADKIPAVRAQAIMSLARLQVGLYKSSCMRYNQN